MAARRSAAKAPEAWWELSPSLAGALHAHCEHTRIHVGVVSYFLHAVQTFQVRLKRNLEFHENYLKPFSCKVVVAWG